MRAVTSMTMDPVVLSEAQAKAKSQGTNVSRVVEGMLRQWLDIQEETSLDLADQIAAYKAKASILEKKQADAQEKERKRKSRLIIMKEGERNEPIF